MVGFDTILLTCEHGGNRVPTPYREAFEGHRELLRSHRGHDEGALAMARSLQRSTGAPLIASTVTRLLVDLNRPETERSVFSEITRRWPASERERLLDVHHRPHWRDLFARVAAENAARRTVLHLACHSFTPVLNGRVRCTDLALLYDPRRRGEATLCVAWTNALARALPGLRVHRNRPYRGWSPGLTTSLREAFGARGYLGVEIELGQRLSPAERKRVHRTLVSTLTQVSGSTGVGPASDDRAVSGGGRRSTR